MSDWKSNNSRRKLLKSIAAGSGAIVAGKSLPDAWCRPVVDSVLLPAHALTSACSTINIRIELTVTNATSGGSGYSIFRVGTLSPIESDGGAFSTPNTELDFTISHTFGPGQYLVAPGFGGEPGSGSIMGRITVSCCSGDSLIVADETISGSNGSVSGCALVTLGDDGTCMIELDNSCPPGT